MAVVFLAHNGIGVGHLARSLALCDAFVSLGEAPVVFSQGAICGLGDCKYPGKTIPNLRHATMSQKLEAKRDLERYSCMSQPAVVFEDTHPCDVELDASVRRILIVRPTDFDHMEWLAKQYRDKFDAFLIADAPGSPTWIYDDRETANVFRWPNWFVLGPVYRRCTEEQRSVVMRQYRISPDDPICILSMGGGGVRSPENDDIARFFEMALQIGAALRAKDPRTRLLFVKGPLFPSHVNCPSDFEIVQNEPFVPALISVARGAIIRPGFNTTWECIAGGVPFTPVLGTSYREPMQERIMRLVELELATFEMEKFWTDPSWIRNRSARRNYIRRVWSGRPDPTVLVRNALVPAISRNRYNFTVHKGRHREKQFLLALRIDDVVHLDDNLEWLIGCLVSRELHASLEVIPYLCRISEADLERRDSNRLLLVGQHGYAHIPNVARDGQRSEFGMTSLPTGLEAERIARGRDILISRFPNRFSGGFSAPYDSLPPWLGPLWAELGGEYISCVWATPRLSQIPIARPLIETWDWQKHAPRPVEAILAAVRDVRQRAERTGLVIHPWLLNVPEERARVENILDRLLAEGAKATPLANLSTLRRAEGECYEHAPA